MKSNLLKSYFYQFSSKSEMSREEMNSHEILLALTTSNNEATEDLDKKLERLLQNVLPLLPADNIKLITDKNEVLNEPIDIRYQYVHAVISVLKNMQESNAADNTLFSVSQLHTVKVAVELVTSIGMIPCLLPGVGISMAKLCPRASQLCEERTTDLQKYNRLCFSVRSLVELFNDIIIGPAVLSQLGVLLAALLQLCHAPLIKPSLECKSVEQENMSKQEFKMTTDLYQKLTKDQEQFIYMLHQLLKNCPQPECIRELMVILGIKGAPSWLKRETRRYLVERIRQPNGVLSITAVVCNDTLDIGEHWDKLDTVSKLVATSHGNNSNEYYQAICPQLLDLLTSTQIKHSPTIANYYITALYNSNPDVCLKNIIEVIFAPLLITQTEKGKDSIIILESEVDKCIQNLSKLFITVEAKFEQLPCKLMSKVAVPLFCLYNDIRSSACALKSEVKQLVLQLLLEESLKNILFSAFLGHDTSENLGFYAITQFGSNGGIEIIGIADGPKYEEFADSMFDLTNTGTLSIDLFAYLLKFLSNTIKSEHKDKTQNLLETEDDTLEGIQKQLAAIKLLSGLANTSTVQEAQIKRPEPLVSFIKSLFNEHIKENEDQTGENSEILYVSLMLVKMILSERKGPVEWCTFDDFGKFLKQYCDFPNVPVQLLLLIQEVIKLIETRGHSKQKHYQDLSIDRKTSNKFEEAIKDLADPLLPVRAHGLITLTKLIETSDPCIAARKGIILKLFQENLKHEDSFIYLAAINGLCALATTYPKVVIETLVQEFIDMPQRISSGDITSETRMKLGEILVRTTRSLGEIAVAYKNILVNGFLCAIRDPDPLIRASSLSCLGELCKVLGFRLGNILIEVIYCISCIIKSDKAPECRRAAVMVCTLLLRGLGRDTLTNLGKDLVELFHGLKNLHDNDVDPVLRLHAQLALEELDHIVQNFLFSPPKLEKRIFLLDPPSY